MAPPYYKGRETGKISKGDAIGPNLGEFRVDRTLETWAPPPEREIRLPSSRVPCKSTESRQQFVKWKNNPETGVKRDAPKPDLRGAGKLKRD